jgi:hypothetical protein
MRRPRTLWERDRDRENRRLRAEIRQLNRDLDQALDETEAAWRQLRWITKERDTVTYMLREVLVDQIRGER